VSRSASADANRLKLFLVLARHEGPCVARNLVHELVRHRRGPLGVGNAAQHVPPQRDQVHQLGAPATVSRWPVARET
jgi:hypothetical protein